MFRALLLLNILLTFILISLGGFVHNTGSSLACPDWPLCYGQLMPVMEGGVLIEHSHRLLASLVGFISILLVIFSRKSKPVVFGKTILALFLVILQGVLGGMTVIFKLPTIVSTAHLGLSMIFFMTLIFIDHKAHYTIKKSRPHVGNLQNLAAYALIFVYAQMILGAFMRHSGLGGVCGVGYEAAFSCHDMVDNVMAWIPSSNEAQLHAFHRYLGAFIGLFVIGFSLFFQRVSTLLGALLFVVVGFQVALGVMTIGTNLGVYITTLHLTGASLLFALLYKSYLILKDQRLMGSYIGPSYLEDIIDLAKPRLSSLVVFTATGGLLVASGSISFMGACIGILATTGIVGGACALNCYMEKDVDGLMMRTANRPLPKDRLPRLHALIFGLVLIIVFTVVLYLATNLLTAGLSLVATVIYLAFYTPLKRKSSWSVFVGAIPGAIPPLMGVTMVTNEIDAMGLVLFGILFFWQFPHFMAIASFRLDEYKKAGLVVTPIVSGLKITKYAIIALTFCLIAVSLIPAFIIKTETNGYLYFAICIGGAFLALANYGLFFENEDAIKKWARQYFWGSIIYLPVLFIGLVLLL